MVVVYSWISVTTQPLRRLLQAALPAGSGWVFSGVAFLRAI
jgi:hypothetical protein